MTLFGLVWICLIFFCYTRKSIKYMVSLTIFSMIIQSSSVLIIGEKTIGPQVITNIAFIILYTFKIRGKGEKKNFTIYSVVMLTIVAIVSSVHNKIISDNILRILQLACYVTSFCFMYNMRELFDKDYVYRIIRYVTIFVLIMGGIQFLCTSGVIPRISLISNLFYNEHAFNVYYWHNKYYRVTSTFMEPSYCACFLVGAFFYFTSLWYTEKKNTILIIAILIEIILTKSTTAYLALSICGVFFSIYSQNKNMKKIFIPLSVCMVGIFLLFGYDTIDSVILSKSGSGSANTRYYWNLRAMKAFYESPIIGVGYKNVRGSSIYNSLLGELGITGLISYIAINISIIIPIFRKKETNDLKSNGIRFSILSIVIAQIIACPDVDLSPYWLFLFIYALTWKIQSDEIKV